MAQEITFNYDGMESAAGEIETLATQYTSKAQTFVDNFTSATSEWEGASKDSMINMINNSVNSYISESIPAIIKSLATLVRSNAESMKKADQQIADSIGGGSAG